MATKLKTLNENESDVLANEILAGDGTTDETTPSGLTETPETSGSTEEPSGSTDTPETSGSPDTPEPGDEMIGIRTKAEHLRMRLLGYI